MHWCSQAAGIYPEFEIITSGTATVQATPTLRIAGKGQTIGGVIQLYPAVIVIENGVGNVIVERQNIQVTVVINIGNGWQSIRTQRHIRKEIEFQVPRNSSKR